MDFMWKYHLRFRIHALKRVMKTENHSFLDGINRSIFYFVSVLTRFSKKVSDFFTLSF